MKQKEIIAHMKAAFVYAELSYCKKRQVGCVLVKDGSIIAIGYNGTPCGEPNECENDENITKNTVIHAEDNALRKLIRRNESSINCHVFVTTAPCVSCAEKLISAGVASVYYADRHINNDGIQYLIDRGFKVVQIK